MTDIVERLKDAGVWYGENMPEQVGVCNDAADEITRLREENKELAGLLEKMLKAHDDYNGQGSSWMAHIYDPIRAALAKHKGEQK